MNTAADKTPDNDEAIEATAAAWLVQRDEGFTPAQAAEFARWCSASPKHAAAVALLEETCDILGKLPELREKPETSRQLEELKELARPVAAHAARAGNAASYPTVSAKANVIRFPTALKIAIGLAACFAVAFATLWFRADRPAFAQSYATATGGYLRVVLPDDSVLELNDDTEAQVRFSNATRQIALTRGEAHFTVAKNSARPFIVDAKGVAVRAVGTAFNVRLDQAAVDVLVTEGRVQVTRDGTPLPASATADGASGTPSAEPSVLAAGQRVVISTEAGAALAPARFALVDADGLREALAWQNPLLVFNDTPLAEVAQQFNRRNRVQLVLADPALNQRPVGGNFRADNVETFVRLLEQTNEITVERPDAQRIILRKAAR